MDEKKAAPATGGLRILLADDHSFIREGLKALINEQSDMLVVGEAADGEEALRKLAECNPNVIVMDISMPRMNGTLATREIKRLRPRTAILALSMHEDMTYLRNLLDAGASGYVLKRSAPQELIHALRSVASGGTYIDPALAGKMTSSFVRRPGARGGADMAPSQELSEREETVLRLVARGHTSREIGEQLSISPKSVDTYKSRAMEKLGIESRTDAVRYATQQGWLNDL
jgi:two-component system response regulator NreC